MSWLLDVFRTFAVWRRESLMVAGTHALPESKWPTGGDPESEAEREAWEDERARLAFSPWWM